MRWSQLKSRVESGFAVSVKGRVEVWSTRYRRAVHRFGEAWITIDGQKVVTMGTLRSENEYHKTGGSLLDATRTIHDRGVFSSWDLNRSLFVYLNLNIEDAWNSENAIIRAFAVLDRRFGKRRLAGLEVRGQHPLVEQFAFFRCQAEGIAITSSKADAA